MFKFILKTSILIIIAVIFSFSCMAIANLDANPLNWLPNDRFAAITVPLIAIILYVIFFDAYIEGKAVKIGAKLFAENPSYHKSEKFIAEYKDEKSQGHKK
jgi:uncharacterized membrane protein